MTKVGVYQKIRSKWKRKSTKTKRGNMKAITMPNIPAYLSNEVILDSPINDFNRTKTGKCNGPPFSQLVKSKTKKPFVSFFQQIFSIKKSSNLSNSFFCDEEGNSYANSEKPNFSDYGLLFLEKLNCVQRVITGYGSYFFFHLLYIVTVVITSAGIIFFVEGSRIPYIDTLFTTASACSMTGLSSVNTANLSIQSVWTLLIVMILGNNVLLSTVPLIIRRYFYQQWAKKVLNTFSLNSSHQKLNMNGILNREVVEYRALTCLLKYTLYYCILVPFFSTLFIYLYLIGINRNGSSELSKAKENKLIVTSNKLFFALFHSVSAFSNCGFVIHEQNLLPFASHYGVLIPLSFSILLGNTFYPIAIYFVVKVMHRIHQQRDMMHLKKKKTSFYDGNTLNSVNKTLSYSKTAATQFLLDNPRRCYTHMFSETQTFSLLCVASFLLFSQVLAFIYLDLNRLYLKKYSVTNRLLIAWFQNVSTRTAGFSCIDVTRSSEAMKLLWVFFMYIVSYPFILAVRTSTIEVAPTCHCSGSIHQASFKCVLLKVTRNLRYFFNSQYLHQNFLRSKISSLFPKFLVKNRKKSISSVNLFHDEICQNHSTSISKEETFASYKHFNKTNQAHCHFSHETNIHPFEESLSLTKSTDHNQVVGQRDSSLTHNPSLFETPSREISSDIFAHQMYRVLIQDIFWLFLATVCIAVLEDTQFQSIPRLNIFSIVFETVSAYGTVGLSLGANDVNAVSLSGLLSNMSKFILIIVMIMGRHRSLPFAIDRAVNLPNLLHMATAVSINKPLDNHSSPHQIHHYNELQNSNKNNNNTPYPKKIHHSF